jgi:hypothetical protein
LRKRPRTTHRFREPRFRHFLGALSGATAFVIASLAGAGEARADSMDPAIERLIQQPAGLPKGITCQSLAANPSLLLKAPFPKNAVANAASYVCLPDNAAFDNLLSEYAFAIAPTAFHPARTTGFGGFAFTIDASYTKINSNQSYWHEGTQGPPDPNTNQFSVVNVSPDAVLQVYSLKARKGFPFGFELTGDVGYIANTVMWVAGGDIRWALLEGFRTGVLGVLPDISVGTGVRSLSGTSEFDLTTVGIDVQVSKPITLADSAVLSPYIGYQRLYVYGDSQTVSLAPNVNPLTQCGYSGNTVTGQPVCRNGGLSALAFNEDTTFDRVRNHRDRGILGVNYRFEALYLAGQFLVDLIAPGSEDSLLVGSRQWTLSFEAGAYF